MPEGLVVGIDAGGTSFKIGIAGPDGSLLATERVATGAPRATLREVCEAIDELCRSCGGRPAAIGLAAFGPVGVDRRAADYGNILETPKPGWAGTDLRGPLEDRFGVPVEVDTDVNGALEAEMAQGAAAGAARAAYVTVGTGIGVGVKTEGGYAGRPYHPELGHVRPARHPNDRGFKGICPYHGGCFEGLASGPAIEARFGGRLQPDDRRIAIPAHYLGQLSCLLVLGFRVERIVFGGGVMGNPDMIGAIREAHLDLMAGYVCDVRTNDLIVVAGLGEDAGIIGGTLIAGRARPRAGTF